MSRLSVVYRAYGHDRTLLYVGVTGNLPERIKGHRSQRSWWKAEVAEVEHDAPMPREDAFASEREQIRRLRPKYNERRIFRDGMKTFTLRIARAQLDQMREIAAGEHRTLVQKLRVMIEREIADHDEQVAA